jgi:hypothetical protein
MLLMMLIFSIGIAAYTVISKEGSLYKQREKKMNDAYFMRSFMDHRFQFSEYVISKNNSVLFLNNIDTLGVVNILSNKAVIKQNGVIDSLDISITALSSHFIGNTVIGDSIIDYLAYTINANGNSFNFTSGKTYGADVYMNNK